MSVFLSFFPCADIVQVFVKNQKCDADYFFGFCSPQGRNILTTVVSDPASVAFGGLQYSKIPMLNLVINLKRYHKT